MYSCTDEVTFSICRINRSAGLKLKEEIERGRSGEFFWKPYVLEDEVRIFKDFPIKDGLLSDLTMATNSIVLSVRNVEVELTVKKLE